MKKLLLTLLGIALSFCIQAQIDSDFYKYKKQADDCFTNRNFSCAEQNYKRALVVKANDKYCKRQLGQVEKKKKAEIAERKRQAQIAEQQKINEAEAERKRQAQIAEQQKIKEAEVERQRQAQIAEQQKIKEAEVERQRQAQIAEQQRIKEAEVERQRQAQIAEQQRIKEAEVERQRQAQIAEQQRQREAERKRSNVTNSVLKIVTGALGIGAGVYAQTINSQWKTKLNALNSIANIADVGNTGIIVDKANYDVYKKAYDEAKAFQSKTTLRNVCLGIAAGSILAEAYLFLIPKKYSNVVVLKPTTDHYGLGLSVKF